MPQADYLIKNGTVITVDKERRIIRDGAVAIQGNRIAAVGKAAELEKDYDAGRVIDAGQMIIMPGLVNSHLHFYHTMHRGLAPENLGGWPWSNFVHSRVATVLTPEDEIYGGLTVLLETLRSGTTTVFEAGSYDPVAVIEGISQIGMRGLMGRRTYDQAILGHDWLIDDTDTCLRENLKFLEKYKDGYNGGLLKAGVDVVGIGRVSDRLYIESKKMADKYGTCLNFHLAAMMEEVTDTRMKTGHRPVEHLYKLGVLGPNVSMIHMVQVTEWEIDMLAETGTHVIHCPSTALKLSYGLSDVGRFPEMLAKGVNVTIGTDASDCSNYADMIRLMYLAAALPKDYRYDPNAGSAETAIEMATINGARAIGMADEIGSLEAGKKADVILISMKRPEWFPLYSEVQNLVYSASGDSVHTVFIDGKIVMEDRVVKTVDEEEVLARCQELSKGVLERSGLEVPSVWPIS
ncbi:MAG: amidohydrolase [Nitrospinota bacterium]|jgi:cytosine/adenosine deaminase-related metal-dependent hydrolase|nr:amidohydrolase [Nitrospinota bacterium]